MEDTKESVVTIRNKYSNKFEGQFKGSTGRVNIDQELKKENYLHLNQTSIFFYYEKDIEVQDMEPYNTFFVLFDYTKLNLNNINNPVKTEHHQLTSKKIKGESCGTNLWQNHIT